MIEQNKTSGIKTGIENWLSEKGVNKRRLFVLVVFLLALIAFYRPIQASIRKVSLECIQFRTYDQIRETRNKVLALRYAKAKPIRLREVAEPELEARSALIVLIKDGEKRVLFEKEADKPLPIASLTKLMSALVVVEQYDLDQTLVLSEKAASQPGEPNFFREGEEFYARDLLYSVLVESSNRAAFALAEARGEQEFVREMNKKARELEMHDTQFFNPTGLDPELPHGILNHSTANDLVKLARELSTKTLVSNVSRTKTREIYTASGWFHHQMDSTNKMLDDLPGLIIAKTGRTSVAGQCLLLGFKNRGDNNLVFGVVLGAEDNFKEMEKLIDWVNKAYKW